jgi:hypothetical protein
MSANIRLNTVKFKTGRPKVPGEIWRCSIFQGAKMGVTAARARYSRYGGKSQEGFSSGFVA